MNYPKQYLLPEGTLLRVTSDILYRTNGLGDNYPLQRVNAGTIITVIADRGRGMVTVRVPGESLRSDIFGAHVHTEVVSIPLPMVKD